MRPLRIRLPDCDSHLGVGKLRLRLFAGDDACASEDDDGGADSFFAQCLFRLDQLQVQAYRPQIVACQEIKILIGKTIGGTLFDRVYQRIALTVTI